MDVKLSFSEVNMTLTGLFFMLRKDDFMEKIILKNGQEFYVPQLGVVSNDITRRRKITFMSELCYNDVLALLSDKANTDQIEYALENGAVITTYTDCVALKSLSVDLDAGTYTAEFSTDATERIVHELQAKVAQLEQTIETLTTAKTEPVPDEDPVELPEEETEVEPVEENPVDEPSNQEP